MAVHLTRIYTKTGDTGTTALGDMSRVRKTDPRLVAYADVDEANSAIGAALALGGLPAEIVELLRTVQNDLFASARTCAPFIHSLSNPAAGDRLAGRATVGVLRHSNARRPAKLPAAGRGPGAALLHVARTWCAGPSAAPGPPRRTRSDGRWCGGPHRLSTCFHLARTATP